MVIAWVALLVFAAGLVLYAVTTTNTKVLEIARAMMWCGLLVVLWHSPLWRP